MLKGQTKNRKVERKRATYIKTVSGSVWVFFLGGGSAGGGWVNNAKLRDVKGSWNDSQFKT